MIGFVYPVFVLVQWLKIDISSQSQCCLTCPLGSFQHKGITFQSAGWQDAHRLRIFKSNSNRRGIKAKSGVSKKKDETFRFQRRGERKFDRCHCSISRPNELDTAALTMDDPAILPSWSPLDCKAPLALPVVAS